MSWFAGATPKLATAVMGLAYNVMGSAFLMERKKGTCRWQQGFLGLGLGTRELVPLKFAPCASGNGVAPSPRAHSVTGR